MSKLHLASGLDLPVDVTTQKNAFLGRTGSGKTYGATKLAELLLQHDAQIVALDPVGVWYGLRIGSDGKEGFPIPVFGGLHGDIPLLDTAGAQLADFVVDRGISAVLDVSQFETDAAKARFASAFAERFFFRKKAAPAPVHLFLEECQEFVPQNPQGGDAAMLHAFTRMAKLGRNFGIGISLISQRPQEVNKKVLNMTEVMFAFQMRGPQERKTIREWSSDKDLEVDIAAELPSLQVGECFVSSPQWLQVEKKVRIARKVTADVSSTPKVGEAPRAARPLTPIDIEQLRTTMAATIECAKADDPKELRKEIARLGRELKAASRPGTVVEVGADRIERAVQKAVADERKRQDRQRRVLQTSLRNAISRIQRGQHELEVGVGLLQGIDQEIDQNWMPAPADEAVPSVSRASSVAAVERPGNLTTAPARPAPVAHRAAPIDGLEPAQQKVLDALALLARFGIEPATRTQLAIMSGYSEGGRFNNLIGKSRTMGLLDYPQEGAVQLTDAGRDVADASALNISSLDELHGYWLRKVPASEGKVLEVLIGLHPDSIERAALAAHTGYALGGRFNNIVGRLRTLGLATYPAEGQVAASDLLFPRGLR